MLTMPDRGLFAIAATQALLARELAATAPILSGVYGNFGLIVQPQATEPTALPEHLLGACVVLAAQDTRHLHGSLRCSVQALPFVGESFKLVIAQHVLEQIEDAQACAAELARVLAPEGIALVFGFNPFGTWRPWISWQQRYRTNRLHLQSARAAQACLARAHVDTLQVRFPGMLWPRAETPIENTRSSLLGRCGSSWMLIARKRRSTLTPLRLRNAPERAIKPRLVPGAHRECA